MKKFLLKTNTARLLMLGLYTFIGTQGVLYADTPIEQVHAQIEHALGQTKAQGTHSDLSLAYNKTGPKYSETINQFLDTKNHITFLAFKTIINELTQEYINTVIDPMIASDEYKAIRSSLTQLKKDLLGFAAFINNYKGKSAVALGIKLVKSYKHMMPVTIVAQNGGAMGLVKKLGHRLKCTGQGCRV